MKWKLSSSYNYNTLIFHLFTYNTNFHYNFPVLLPQILHPSVFYQLKVHSR